MSVGNGYMNNPVLIGAKLVTTQTSVLSGVPGPIIPLRATGTLLLVTLMERGGPKTSAVHITG